ncbi:GAF domain-containing protein [Arthrobacter sp. AFG20]|uniref:GAF domain-containing protein n=1 Tax=Arthrobacter sp. AFG20 TaxID=1688671 RepID=UPI0035B58CF1
MTRQPRHAFSCSWRHHLRTSAGQAVLNFAPTSPAASRKLAPLRLTESRLSTCLSSIRQQVVVHVSDLTDDDGWPAFTAAALEAGVGSSLSVPLVLAGEAEAGLNLYSTRSHGFSGDDISMVETYSYHASKALRLAVRISQLAERKPTSQLLWNPGPPSIWHAVPSWRRTAAARSRP